MARDKAIQPNIDKSDTGNYPNGRIKDNSGSGDGTPVNEMVYGDIHEAFAKMMRLYGITYSNLPDNEINGYQLVEAIKALATKNDYVLDIGARSNKLTLPVKIGVLQPNETFMCKALLDYNKQATIISNIDGVEKAIVVVGDFVTGDYLRMINTPNNIVLLRLIDVGNINEIVKTNYFLKAATQEEENQGQVKDKATTPFTHKNTFINRVIGGDSRHYLAATYRNGLLSKEDKIKIDSIGDSPVKNRGFFQKLDVRGSRGTLPHGGDIIGAHAVLANGSQVTCTMRNAMKNNNYLVKYFIESMGDSGFDNDILYASFKVENTKQFTFNIDELGAFQNLRVHFEVIQL